MRFCPKDGSLLDAVAKRGTQGLTSTEFCCRVCKCAVAPRGGRSPALKMARAGTART